MNKPLKNKGKMSSHQGIEEVFYFKSDIISAVEWLKQRAKTIEGECVVSVEHLDEAFTDIQ